MLVTMMAEFYSDSPYTLNSRRATDAFNFLLSDERLGNAWLIQSDATYVGYVVVTYCHSMTYGGLVAVVDDFFIHKTFRGAGLGKASMSELRSLCSADGSRPCRSRQAATIQRRWTVYKHAGFVESDHVHLTLPLAAPTHAPSLTGG